MQFNPDPNKQANEDMEYQGILTNKTNFIPAKTKPFKKTFFLYSINEWNNLNAEVRVEMLNQFIFSKR